MTSNTIDPNPDSRSAGRRKDPAWKYHSLVNPNDLNTFKCNFCGKLTKGGVYRAKQHLAGGYRNAEICSKCPPHVRDEIIEFMSKKKGKNDFDDMPDFDDIDTLGDDVDDEMDVGAFQNRGKRPMQGQASSMQQKKQRQQQRGPLDLFLSAKPKVSNQKDAKGKQTTIESHVNKELRENACVWFSRWMYEAGIPFNAVNYPSFKPMMEAVGRAGPGMKPPSFHEVRVPYLKKEVEHTKEIMKSHREEWARYGCTIMCDGWKDKRDRSLLNFLVNSPKGSVFIESIDTSSYAKDGMKLYQLLDRFVEEIGEANVVQVVTDNASANVLAGEFLMTKHKNLYWTPCAAHCLDLMLEDIFKIPRLKSTFQKACSVNGYLYSSAQVLNMMRSFTQKREMLRPGKTRFATAFLTLSRFHKQKANLRKMFTSEEWTNSRFAKETRGKQAAQTVLQESFWKNILFALKVSGPLVKVLRVVDNEDKPAMPYIYEAMDRAKEAIAKSFDDESKYEKIFEIIDERWNVQLHRPLHAAGYYLNPAFFYSNESIREDNEVIEGLYACIERLVPTAEVQDKLSKELSFYKNSEGLFGKQICIRGRNQLSPVEWWSQFGTGTPNLQKFAMKICSLTCSSSGCERNWSIFEHLVGGIDIVQQSIALAKRPHIVVATPGRISDHLSNTKGFSLRTLKYLVLDEADRLLNEDFEKAIDVILEVIPRDRRTYLFSATMTKKVRKLQRACLRNPVKIEAASKYSTVDTLKQQYLFVPAKHKDCYLVYILTEMSGSTSMVFTRTCDSTRLLALILRNLGLRAIPISGHMSQAKRLGALNKFKAGECNILVCTDVASRGLDIPSVDMVINYDIPSNSKDYIHRVGRTARAGRSGIAISIVNQYELEWYIQIEKLIGKKLPMFPAEEEEVLLLLERVTEAKRISQMKVKESGGKKKRKGGVDEGEEEIERYLNRKSSSKKSKKR